MGKYTLETLRDINNRFCSRHILTDRDVEMANNYVELIEGSRSKEHPCVGDIIELTTDFGDYYENAHIEIIESDNVNYCERPYVPFVWKMENETGIRCSTSGGAWGYIPKDKLTYVGQREKIFCDWGNCGACVGGAVEFAAKVSVWRYVDGTNKFISRLTGNPFTTKDFNRMAIYYNADKYGMPKDGYDYIYFGDGRAWKNDLEIQAWLRTYRAEVFDCGHNGMFVWYWKEEMHSIPPEEYNSIYLPEDALLNNGLQPCKRIYDEENHIIHTYWVWYWDDPTKDFMEAATEQNRIREERNKLRMPMRVNQVAINEIRTGKVQPIDLSFIRN